ncbi:MAG TPA: alpha/beta hydrolase [Thermoleophilaceae bacterium]|nr:alpha/beta hydrolase [Thermoleophilaceae bacterium]
MIVLVHSGVCDARMWDGFDVPGLRHELRGFGQTPLPPSGSFSHADDLIEALGGEPAAMVGASYGGWVCLQVAAARPELVTDLVLLGAPVPDHDWSEEMEDFARDEEGLLEQGDLRGAAILNADFWLESAEPRDLVIEMQERAFQLEAESEAEGQEPESIDLTAITARTLVGVGELDKRDFHDIAERLAREIPQTESVVIPGAGHLPSLDRPEATASVICRFLSI